MSGHKPLRHADNIGHNIICLQHRHETLQQFVARCDALRASQNLVPCTDAQHKAALSKILDYAKTLPPLEDQPT